jgi:hypothetical protein
MDPLSIAASLAGLITITGQLVRFGFTFGSTVHDHQKEVQGITNEVVQLSGILHAIQPIVEDAERIRHTPPQTGCEGADVAGSLRNKRLIIPVEEIVACENTMVEISQELGKVSLQAGKFWSNTAKRLHWSVKQAPLSTLLNRLERHKATFSLALSAHSTYVTSFGQSANLHSDLLLEERAAAVRERATVAEERHILQRARKRTRSMVEDLTVTRKEGSRNS